MQRIQHADKFQDPKMVFLINIVAEDQRISEILNAGFPASAAKRIAILLSRLDAPKADMKFWQLKTTLTIETYNQLSPGEVYKAYSELSAFLNRTYFKEFKGWNGVDPDAEFDSTAPKTESDTA